MIYSWYCEGCGIATEVHRKVAEREVPPDEPCSCDTPRWVRDFSGDGGMIMNAAHPDGVKRLGFYLEREAARLDVQAASAPPKQATELRKEATNLRKRNLLGKD